jgi:hypothetical protein
MPGASALTIEPVLKAAQKTKYGLPKHIPLPLSSWTLNTGVVLAAVGAGSAGNANAATNLACIQWDDTADQTDIIRCSIVLPPDFRTSIDGNSPKIVLYVKARVLDGTGSATANTNLALQADAYWHKTGDADLSTHSAVVSNVIGAVDYTAAQENGFALYKFDLTTNMSAAQLLSLAALDTFQMRLYPNEAVGTDLYIEVIHTFVVYDAHASIPSDVVSTLSY